MFPCKLSLHIAVALSVGLLLTGCPERTTTSQQVAVTQPGQTQTTPEDPDEVLQQIGDRVYFDYDRYELRADAQDTLRKQADFFRQRADLPIRIEGHCDERGTREYNLALGDRRAEAVKSYLAALGIDASRITTISFGKERPAVVGDDEAAWALNRRGVTVVAQN